MRIISIKSILLIVILLLFSGCAGQQTLQYRAQKVLARAEQDSSRLSYPQGGITNGGKFKPLPSSSYDNNDAALSSLDEGKSIFKLIPTSDTSFAKKVALLIGNAAYETQPLVNPINDVDDISSRLQSLGFEVLLYKNANSKTMENAVSIFRSKLCKNSLAFFYFAGHGVQIDGINYLVPVNSEIKNEIDLKYESLNFSKMLSYIDSAEATSKIVILDACRNNPFSTKWRSVSRGLSGASATTGTFISFSTAPGDVAYDGSGRNSIFAKYFLKYMKHKGLTVEQIFKGVRHAVMQETSGRQIPWDSSSLLGDIVLNP